MFRKKSIAILAGALLALAFAPLAFYPLAVVCPAVLLLLWLQCSPRRAFFVGLFFGIGFFSVGVSWVFISIHVFGHTSIFLSLLITALFIFVLALFIAFQGTLLNFFFPENNRIKRYVIFPSLWTLGEWLRSWMFTGFPWLLLGTSQVHSPLAGYAPLVGGLGLTFLLTLSAALVLDLCYPLDFFRNGAIGLISSLNAWLRSSFTHPVNSGPRQSFALNSNQFLCFKRSLFLYQYCRLPSLLPRKTATQLVLPLLMLILLWVTGYALTFIHWTQPIGKPLQVSLVQANIPQEIKWESRYLQATLANYRQLTQAHWNSRLIIWPEAAVPLLQHDALPFLNDLDREAKQHGTTLIMGIPVQRGFQYYNSMIALGLDHASYDKRQLVIFGEYLPSWISWAQGLLNFLALPMSDFSPGPTQQPAFRVAGVDLGTFICYEIAYPSLVRQALPAAQLLLTINDDAWFGHSFALSQHLQVGAFQALVTGRYLLFLSNTGMTAIVAPQGKIQAQLVPLQRGVLTGSVYTVSGVTPWVSLGDSPTIVFLVGLIVLCFVYQRNTLC